MEKVNGFIDCVMLAFRREVIRKLVLSRPTDSEVKKILEERFKAMGFDRAFPPGTTPETTIQALRELLGIEENK